MERAERGEGGGAACRPLGGEPMVECRDGLVLWETRRAQALARSLQPLC